ncbi:hypothetical protein KIN20_009089 [Parelaphostrongylus tenuis]|uniref:DAN domain-containing protein n=1 Tax=Parelaphostrongylus tenuis TaxID=148309 RepID=A0AAD5MQ43_PARTN|nr:hypothetical protein KIN20_009089 [Parelaphostrongylus tenuis]
MGDTEYSLELRHLHIPNGRDKWSDVRQLAYRQRTMHVSSLSGGALRKLKCFLMLLIVCTMTAVRCRPSGSDTSSNAEPLSVADGYIHFSVANDSRFREISRKAFESLISTDAKQELSSSHEIIFRRSDDITAEKLEKKNRKPERRKPLVDGRNHALITLNDPQTRSIQRCEGAKFKQRVKAPGCLTKVIINRFCHGTCSSYFIPRMSSKKLKAVFRSCAACAPKEYDRFDVTLDCPGQDPPQITKSIIKKLVPQLNTTSSIGENFQATIGIMGGMFQHLWDNE